MSVGIDVTGMTINLSQLQTELSTAGVTGVNGLGIAGPAAGEAGPTMLFTYDVQGQAADFPSTQQATAQQVVSSHVAMRDRADVEYSAEFQNPATTTERKQEIRDITAGLLPREQVPMETA
jgi:hypothetical protein